ncbi:response regulator transcription factor [Sneathiella aquimaris]|uniref:response regulator transcription factor n=1 Tax=Sneathiella aquimaris TaxID=2599305 RepID=UPI00146C27E1|nr:response regulator transcription factor [Sneathiella aquimaris]
MRALIVDNSEICRRGYKVALEEKFDGCTICEASNLREAYQCIDDHGVDIVLLGLQDGMTFSDVDMVRLKEYACNTPVLIVGNAVCLKMVREVFENNVKGFLDRSASSNVTMATIDLVLAGGQYFPPEVFSGLQEVDKETSIEQSTLPHPIMELLTPRQVQILQAISEGKSNKDIAQYLGISAGTVKVHVSNLMKKLNAKNRTQAVMMASDLYSVQQ